MLKGIFSKTASVDYFDDKTNFVALDIGTEVLKSMRFTMDAYGVNIHKISRIQQQENAMKSGVIRNLDTVLENCSLSINELTNGLTPEEMPKKIVMGIAGEYIQGVSIIVNYKRDENFEKEVTEREQENILKKIRGQIKEEGEQNLALRIGLTSDDIDILHITVTGLEIGGMPVQSLIGYTGRDVKINLYASFGPKTYVNALKRVAESLNMDLVGIVAQPFAVARAYSGSSNQDFSGIFIDVGGGTTDIAVVERGNVLQTQMFAFGGRVFSKQIAKELSLDLRYAEQRKVKYSNGELSRETAEKVRKIVMPVAQLWMKTLKVAFQNCDDVDTFPSHIYMCGGGSLLPEIKEVMLEFPWKKYLAFPVVPKIEVFTPNKLNNIIDKSGDLRNIYDITPSALAKFAYDKELDSKNYNITFR
jgi:cell division protein FtsA